MFTQTLANQLGLPLTETESISLSAFGAQPSASKYLPVATIKVVTAHGENIPLRVLVVEKIATPLQNHLCRQTHDMPHLRGLKLAHPITSDENFAISLLIGADHYWDIVKDTVIRGQGPTAVASKLGYLLSGPLQTSFIRPSETVVNLLHTLSSTKKEEFDGTLLVLRSVWASLHNQKETVMMFSWKTTSTPQSQEIKMEVTMKNSLGRKTPRCSQQTTTSVKDVPGPWFVVLLPHPNF